MNTILNIKTSISVTLFLAVMCGQVGLSPAAHAQMARSCRPSLVTNAPVSHTSNRMVERPLNRFWTSMNSPHNSMALGDSALGKAAMLPKFENTALIARESQAMAVAPARNNAEQGTVGTNSPSYVWPELQISKEDLTRIPGYLSAGNVQGAKSQVQNMEVGLKELQQQLQFEEQNNLPVGTTSEDISQIKDLIEQGNNEIANYTGG